MALRFAVDTSCIIAAISAWHGNHRAAAEEIERRLGRGEQMAVAVHALTEAYSVLTRFPAPHRLTPADAWTALSTSFYKGGTAVALTARQHADLLGRLAETGLAGGRTYDAIVAECALRAGAIALLTFNARHFEPAPDGIEIVVPA